jgi:hypothetical protein
VTNEELIKRALHSVVALPDPCNEGCGADQDQEMIDWCGYCKAQVIVHAALEGRLLGPDLSDRTTE